MTCLKSQYPGNVYTYVGIFTEFHEGGAGGSAHPLPVDDIALERDTIRRNTATEPRAGSETSRRNFPQRTMISMVLGAVLLFLFGLLLGAGWTSQALQPRLRQRAEERRRLNAEWAAVHAARRRLGRCPRCGYPLNGGDWYPGEPVTDDSTDDD